MAIEDDDPIRRAHQRATARSQELTRRMLGTPAATPPPGSGDPVRRADGTVYDGTGEKPSARDIIAQLNSTTARTDTPRGDGSGEA